MSEASWWWDGQTWRQVGGRRRSRSRQGTGRAVVACVLVLVSACLFTGGLVAFVPYYLEQSFGIVVPAGPAEVMLDAGVVAGYSILIVWPAAAAAFAIWLHRVVANLSALGEPPPYVRPGRAVAWLFAPVAGVFVPFLVLHQVWLASDPAPQTTARRLSLLLTAWWAIWLLVNPVSMQIQRYVLSSLLPRSDVSIPLPWYVVLSWALLEIAAAVLAVVVVIRLHAWQGERFRRLGEAPV